MSLTVDPEDSETEVLGKLTSDLQSNVKIENGMIKGTLKYVDDYTGFSGDVSEQSGNYLVLKFGAEEGSVVTVELIGGTLGHPVTLDEDMNMVLRITDKYNESIEVVSTNNGETVKKTFSLSGLKLEKPSE